MLHIRPVEEKNASEPVRQVYEDIKKTLNIHFVPLLFQYIAGFEEYFLYAWEKQKTNILSDYYVKATEGILAQSRKSIHTVYQESRAMHAFMQKVQQQEKSQIQQTVDSLETLNAKLLILSIGLREGVKGVIVGQQILPKTGVEYEETIFDQFINEQIMHANLKEAAKDVAPGMKMLAPLFGSQSLVVTHYPEFFSSVAREMDELSATEKYLHERVQMEHKAMQSAMHLPYPLGCSYAEIARFAGKRPYFSELLYVLSETFPTKFPRLVFTTALMQYVLSTNSKGELR